MQPGARVFGEGLHDRVDHLWWGQGSEIGQGLRCLGQVRSEQRLRGGPGEGRDAGEHLVAHHREGIDVRAGVDVPVPRSLFWRHIRGRTDRHARAGEPAAALRLRERSRHAEVRQHRMTAEQQDVFRFDVPVNHPFRMGVGECVGDLMQDPHRVRYRELAFARHAVP